MSTNQRLENDDEVSQHVIKIDQEMIDKVDTMATMFVMEIQDYLNASENFSYTILKSITFDMHALIDILFEQITREMREKKQ